MSYHPRRTFVVSLHFPKNLRGGAAEHRIADLRVLIVSAKLLVGPLDCARDSEEPSTALGTHKRRPAAGSGRARQALHSIIPRESMGNRSRGSNADSRESRVQSSLSLLRRDTVGTWHKLSANHLPAWVML